MPRQPGVFGGHDTRTDCAEATVAQGIQEKERERQRRRHVPSGPMPPFSLSTGSLHPRRPCTRVRRRNAAVQREKEGPSRKNAQEGARVRHTSARTPTDASAYKVRRLRPRRRKRAAAALLRSRNKAQFMAASYAHVRMRGGRPPLLPGTITRSHTGCRCGDSGGGGAWKARHML